MTRSHASVPENPTVPETPTAPAIRPAGGADVLAVAELEVVCFGGSAWSASSWADEFARPDRRILVAGRPSGSAPSADVIGYVALIVPEDPRDPVDLTRIAVAPARRRTGVAAGLLAAALRSVTGRAVLLEVAESNDVALALYRRAGFAAISRRRRYYGDSDALIMRWENAVDG